MEKNQQPPQTITMIIGDTSNCKYISTYSLHTFRERSIDPIPE